MHKSVPREFATALLILKNISRHTDRKAPQNSQ